MLYVRMLLIMGVSLYTSRVILQTLGVDDYGIYNVVGGVIAMLGFFISSLSGTGSRFITFALGKGDEEEQKRVFAAVMIIHYMLALLILVLGETIGLWFVCNKLVIPEARMDAALWVYHCSIVTTVIAVISTPYNSLIIAHEKMDIFAYISVVEVVLKLAIVFLLVCIPYDKLVTYAVLLMAVQLFVRMIYNIYCSRRFYECKAKLVWDTGLIKEIFVYAGWTVNGNLAFVGYTQGINILLNMFFGPAVNAARGIAVQVQAAVMTFVDNFQTAVRPQIVKSYAVQDLNYMHSLVVNSSKFGFYLVLLIAFPIVLCINPILKIWLGIVPEHTNTFVVIMLAAGLIEPLKIALINAIHATGDIKKVQTYVATIPLMILPLAYILLKYFDISPEMVMLVYLFVQLFTQYIRVRVVLPKIGMTNRYYFIHVLRPVLYLLPFAVPPFFLMSDFLNASFMKLAFYCIALFVYILGGIWLLGLNSNERSYIWTFIASKFTKKSLV